MAIGVIGFYVLETLCPEELIVSGLCYAAWFSPSANALVILIAGLVAFGIIVTTTAVAPSHKWWVALMSYISGPAVATFVVSTSFVGVLGPLAGAAAGGTAALAILWRRTRPQSPALSPRPV